MSVKDAIRLDRNDAKKVEDRISAGELRIRLKLNNMREYLMDRRLQLLDHLKIMEQSAWCT